MDRYAFDQRTGHIPVHRDLADGRDLLRGPSHFEDTTIVEGVLHIVRADIHGNLALVLRHMHLAAIHHGGIDDLHWQRGQREIRQRSVEDV